MNPNFPKPTYSVIMLIYHRTQELVDMARDCAASVRQHSKDFEFIIVDNGSTVRHDWENECDTYVRLNENKGISRGWNTGLKLSRGRYITIIGDDILVREGWLEAMKEAMELPNAGVVNPHVEHLPPGTGMVENYKWPSGACFMLTQKTLNRVGYFDEEIFPCNTEDWDYWIRVYKAGLKMYRNYSMTVRHKEGQTVHASDLSIHTQGLLERLTKKYGFNPVDVFCGDRSIYEAIQNNFATV